MLELEYVQQKEEEVRIPIKENTNNMKVNA